MINKLHDFLFILCLGMLVSCCTSIDTRVAKGYPYGDDHELNFTRNFPLVKEGFKTPNQFISQKMGPNIPYFDNKDTCEKILKFFDSSCNCDGIDFEKYVIAWIYGSIYRAEGGMIEPRILINHKSKSYTIELRGSAKFCGFKNSYEMDEWCMIPKPPAGYSFNRKNLLPGQ